MVLLGHSATFLTLFTWEEACLLAEGQIYIGKSARVIIEVDTRSMHCDYRRYKADRKEVADENYSTCCPKNEHRSNSTTESANHCLTL